MSARLYLGNLAQTVDEYSLIQLCSKHGKVSKLDYLYHKVGIQKGKPRGFAFVEYSTPEEALRAIAGLHDKLIRGRKLIVTAASEQSQTPDNVRLAALTGNGRSSHPRRGDAIKPTTISLMKGQGVAGASTNRKILALEAKLNSLRKSNPNSASTSANTSPDPTDAGAIASTSKLSADGWLDSIMPTPPNPPNDAAEGSGENAAKSLSSIDVSRAGLPTRPIFDAVVEEKR